MKSIEERIDAWLYRTIPVTPEGFKQRLEGALTELAADLNAEKEKEVAELRAQIDKQDHMLYETSKLYEQSEIQKVDELANYIEIGRLAGVADDDETPIMEAIVRNLEPLSCPVCGPQIRTLQTACTLTHLNPSESRTLKFTPPALLDEVKRVLGDVTSAMDMQEKREREEFHINQQTAWKIWSDAKTQARQLLTRLASK